MTVTVKQANDTQKALNQAELKAVTSLKKAQKVAAKEAKENPQAVLDRLFN